MASIVETYARINLLARRIDIYREEIGFDPQAGTDFHQDVLRDDYPELQPISRKTLVTDCEKLENEFDNNSPAQNHDIYEAGDYIAAKLFEKYISA